MKSEFTAIIDTAPEGGYWAICPEIPGANGQGETIAEAKRKPPPGDRAYPGRSSSRHFARSPERRYYRYGDRRMKRHELERQLRISGCYLKREGNSHSLWINPKTGVTETVPRHNEIKEPLAKKILKKLDAE